MINVGLTPSFFLGLVVLLASIGLYFVRTLKPDVSRDYDIVFSAAGGLSGLILIWQGWRLDPILLFSQVLLAGMAGFFIYESLRLRQVATVQARRSEPIIEDDPPVRRSYKVDLEDTRSFDESVRRRPRPIRSAEDEEPTRYSRPPQLSGDVPPRRRKPRPVDGEVSDPPPRRRPRPVDGEVSDEPRRPANGSRRPPSSEGSGSSPRPRRPRPVESDIDIEVDAEDVVRPFIEDVDDAPPRRRPESRRPRPPREGEGPARPVEAIDVDVDEDFGGDEDFEGERPPRRPRYDDE